jgi:hypothetical protein
MKLNSAPVDSNTDEQIANSDAEACVFIVLPGIFYQLTVV